MLILILKFIPDEIKISILQYIKSQNKWKKSEGVERLLKHDIKSRLLNLTI